MQKRLVPHLHTAIWYADGPAADRVNLGGWGRAAIEDWLELTYGMRTTREAQMCRPIDGIAGWLEYIAKHASRGVAHYQRQRAMMPKGWQKTGRLWGHRGDWPTAEPVEAELDDQQYFRLRRLCRNYQLAKSRSRGSVTISDAAGTRKLLLGSSGRAIVYARHLIRCSDKTLSRSKGGSQWMPMDVMLRLLGSVCEGGQT
jgi:hypothetical protein